MVNICNASKELEGAHRDTGFVLLSPEVAFDGPDLDIAFDRSRVVFPTGQARAERWHQCRTRADPALVLDGQSMRAAYLSYAWVAIVFADLGGGGGMFGTGSAGRAGDPHAGFKNCQGNAAVGRSLNV
jgi:hypothetical protein